LRRKHFDLFNKNRPWGAPRLLNKSGFPRETRRYFSTKDHFRSQVVATAHPHAANIRGDEFNRIVKERSPIRAGLQSARNTN
jgi:hypothetical protein